MSDKLLHTKQEAMKIIGIGEKAFDRLGVSGRRVGKKLKYMLKDILEALDRVKEEPACLSTSAKGRRGGGIVSRSGVYDFAQARKRTIDRKHSLSRHANAAKPLESSI